MESSNSDQARSYQPTSTLTIHSTLELPAEGTYRLDTERTPTVTWSQDVVDNENAGKKKSNVCCIWHGKKKHGSDCLNAYELD